MVPLLTQRQGPLEETAHWRASRAHTFCPPHLSNAPHLSKQVPAPLPLSPIGGIKNQRYIAVILVNATHEAAMSLDQKHQWKNTRDFTSVKTHSAAEIRNVNPMALPIIKASI